MSFGENLQYLRKESSMTQEDLADALEVSRQSISKWESDINYPELEKIMQICQLFGCDLDTLMRGDIASARQSDTAHYDEEYNRFTWAIALATFLVMTGVSLLVTLTGVGLEPIISTAIFMTFVLVAVVIYIVAGIQHESFTKRHPYIQPFYSEQTLARFERRFPYFIAVPTALILLGVIWVIVAAELLPQGAFSKDAFDALCAAPLLWCVTISVFFYIYGGMQKSKYDIEAYNRENAQDAASVEQRNRIERWSAIIMLTATAAFLLMGLLGNLWHIAWVVYPIGGILCGIASVVIKKEP